MSDLALAFLPLFVAVDVVGLLPIYLGWTASLSEVERRPVALEATLTATVVGVSFLLAGDAILTVLGITVGDLQVAGGLLLLVFAIHGLVHPEQPLRQPTERLGVMPLGVPMIAGPAVLTTLLALARTHGHLVTIIAFALNMVIVWIALRWAALITSVIGPAGAQAVAKVSNLLLAAIGVMLVRHGVAAALRP